MKKNKNIKVCHMTSVHPAKDGRIFHKECTSLAKAGFDVTLVAAGTTDEVCNGVKIVGVPVEKQSRIHRMLRVGKNVYKKALENNADIYHFHDPELLPYALKLKKKGKKVIFDSHENVPADIRNKKYLPRVVRSFLGNLYEFLERRICKRIDGVISVTPHIVERLRMINPNTSMITNYPIISDACLNQKEDSAEDRFAYIGPIKDLWNVRRIIQCIGKENGRCKLVLAGPADISYVESLKLDSGWNHTDFKGKVKPAEVQEIYSHSSGGFALLQPTPNTDGRLGTLGNTKLFEIMYAGVPVICTDFKLWKEIVEGNNAGICVNPDDEHEIVEAMHRIVNNPDLAREMGNNGRRAVLEEYNWSSQEKELIKFYESL